MSNRKFTYVLMMGMAGTALMISCGSGNALAQLTSLDPGMPVPATGINAANGALPAPAPPPPCPVPLPATNPVATPPCAVVVPVGLPPAQQASPTIPTTHSTMCLAPEDKKLKEPAPLKSSLPTKPDNLLEN